MLDKDKAIDTLQTALADAQRRAEDAERSRDWWMAKCKELEGAGAAEKPAAARASRASARKSADE